MCLNGRGLRFLPFLSGAGNSPRAALKTEATKI